MQNTGEAKHQLLDLKSEFDEYLETLKKKAEAEDNDAPADKRADIIGDNMKDINDRHYGNNM